jgi:hypothetical protein
LPRLLQFGLQGGCALAGSVVGEGALTHGAGEFVDDTVQLLL